MHDTTTAAKLLGQLNSECLKRDLHDVIAADGAAKAHRDTLIILDPSDVLKGRSGRWRGFDPAKTEK